MYEYMCSIHAICRADAAALHSSHGDVVQISRGAHLVGGAGNVIDFLVAFGLAISAMTVDIYAFKTKKQNKQQIYIWHLLFS